MRTSDESLTAFACEACGNVGVGTGEIRCCDAPMHPVETSLSVDTDTDTDTPAAVTGPTLDDLLGTVFDMSATELELCLCVMEGGELTVSALVDDTGYDRSVVTRHLNHLADLSVLHKRRRLLERGGEVYVYTPADPDAVRERFRRLFLAWVGEATALIDDLRREKVESIADSQVDERTWKIYQRE